MYVEELDIAGKVTVLFGLILTLASFIIDPSQFLLLSASFQTQELSGPVAELLSGYSVIIGALIMVIGLLIIALSKNYDPSQFNLLIIAFSSWFLIDSLASAIFGYEYNVIVNMVILILILAVLYRVKSRYHDQTTEIA